MKIGVLGTRGIPNQYGGFEEFAEKVSALWVLEGHEVLVYCEGNEATEDVLEKSNLSTCYSGESPEIERFAKEPPAVFKNLSPQD